MYRSSRLLLLHKGRYSLVKAWLQFLCKNVYEWMTVSHPSNFMSRYISFMTQEIHVGLVMNFSPKSGLHEFREMSMS